MASNKFIEYYGMHRMSPVKQDLKDLDAHCAKREKLYRQLGVPGIAFEKKEILEVGPGSGYNTLAFILCGGVVTLVEPNKTGVAEMRKLFAEHGVPEEKYTINECAIEEIDFQKEFDIVIAEGFLHSIDNSEEIIKKLSGHVKEGGVIVITCMDAVSMFVEQMKRLVCHILIKDISDYELQVEKCTAFFEKQMKNASGMSRSVEDWVRDDMLNPAFNNEKILDMEKALKIYGKDFSFLGSSQRIFTDYSWYKDLAYDERQDMIRQYRAKRHNFLMTGMDETILLEEEGDYFARIIQEIREDAIEYEENHSDICLGNIEKKLNLMEPVALKINRRCADFVEETAKILGKLRRGETVIFEEYETFYSAVGRTQQYLSMVKNKTPRRN